MLLFFALKNKAVNGQANMQIQGPRRTFLARPFWRDYVLAYVLIGLGFMLSSPGSPVHYAIGTAIFACGAIIFACAVGWSVASTLRAWRSRGTG